MKKGFKRFLSGALATVMAVAGMTIGMATSAMAADGDAFTITADDFYVGQTPSSTQGSADKVSPTERTLTVNGATIELESGSNYYSPFGTGGGSVTNDTGKSWVNEMKIGGARTITVTPAVSGTITLYWYDYGGKNVTVGSKPVIDATNRVVTSESDTCAAGTEFVISLGGSNICFLELSFEPGAVTTYNWTLDTTGLTDVPADGLELGNNTTTSLTNTLSYSGSGYELKSEYENISNSTTGVTVDGTNVTVKPTDDWFNAVAPKTYVSIEPSVIGNTTVYNFVQIDDSEKYLVSVNDTSKSDSTAYADFGGSGGTDDDCYVILDTEGAKLYDDSATAAAKLVIPYKASEGKVTVSGRVTPTNNVGGKWKLVDLGCVSVSTDNNKNIALTNNNDTAYIEHAGSAVKGQTVTYSVTIDFATKTASATITNGATTKEFINVPFEADATNMSSISFTTNNGNSVSAGNDRALTIPSVTIVTENAESSPITKTDSYDKVAVLTDGTNNYVVSVVSSSDIANYALVSQNISGTAIDSSDTVYKNVEIGGVQYSADDFGLNESDYLFVSIIANDNGTDNATVISNIQNSISTVLTNN